MSNQYSGDQSGQPGNNGQFPGQIPPPPEVNQFSGQTPPPPEVNQFPGEMPPPPEVNQFSGQMPPPPEVNQFPGQMPPPPEVNQFSGQMPPLPAQKRNKPMALLAMMVVAALVVIGGGAYAITRVLFPSGGYSTPDDLAASIENAFDTKSLESLASALPPSELAAAMAWQQDYKADGGTDWSKMTSPEALQEYLEAIVIAESDMRYTVEEKSDQIALIRITQWTGDIVIRHELADKLRSRYAEAKGTSLTQGENDFFDELRDKINFNPIMRYGNILDSFPDGKLTLVAVNEGGRWYLSPSMTMAEQTLGSDRRAVPHYDADFTDVEGASSPEEAVSGMVDALCNGASMSDKDFYRFLDLPERRIAAVYADADSSPLFAVRGVGMNEFMNNVQIDWGLSSTKVSGGAIVSVGTTSITADDFSASFNGDTVTYTVPKSGRGSRSSSKKSQTVRFTEGLVNPERLGIFTVRDSTGWHVSAARTSGNLSMLKVADGALDQAIDGAGEFLGYYDSDMSRDEIRDIISLRGEEVIVVIVWNFMKNAD